MTFSVAQTDSTPSSGEPHSTGNKYKGQNPASPDYPEQEWSHFDHVVQRRP